tara:strand:+ start:72894 stop:73208 length:315 start_codon:yes stop_codon:yes gene_type:complete
VNTEENMMKHTILSIAMVLLLGTGIASVTLAQKPEHAGSGKGVMKDEAPVVRETEQSREKKLLKDMEQKREMKAEQERKELGKGSEQGRDMRQEHSRKWWGINI